MAAKSASSFFPAIAAGEGKKILGLVLVCFAVSHARRKTMRKRWLGKDAEEKPVSWVDHPFVPYLLENAYIVFAAIVFKKFGVIDHQRPLATYLSFVLRNTLMVNSGLFFQRLCAVYLYSHVPYFTNTKPSADLRVILSDYFRCNFLTDLVNAAFLTQMISSPKMIAARPRLESMEFKLFPYLGKLLFGRIIVDIVFYLAHRWLHTDWAYKNIHARHHEHTAPRLQTNYHFVALDLFIEATVPVLSSALISNACGIVASPFEEDLLFQTFFLFEAGSHTGKELPVVTWFPPLSPIVDYFTKMDQRLIEYHTKHHMLYNCNYSISPWPDKFMGSYRMEYVVPKDNENKGA